LLRPLGWLARVGWLAQVGWLVAPAEREGRGDREPAAWRWARFERSARGGRTFPHADQPVAGTRLPGAWLAGA
jgi:hypothetical protein